MILLWETNKQARERAERKLKMTIDRSEVARALAKAIAYKNCGKDTEAAEWARRLVHLLECAEILN